MYRSHGRALWTGLTLILVLRSLLAFPSNIVQQANVQFLSISERSIRMGAFDHDYQPSPASDSDSEWETALLRESSCDPPSEHSDTPDLYSSDADSEVPDLEQDVHSPPDESPDLEQDFYSLSDDDSVEVRHEHFYEQVNDNFQGPRDDSVPTLRLTRRLSDLHDDSESHSHLAGGRRVALGSLPSILAGSGRRRRSRQGLVMADERTPEHDGACR